MIFSFQDLASVAQLRCYCRASIMVDVIREHNPTECTPNVPEPRANGA